MTVIDVGANIGYYAALIQSVIGPSGKLLLVEPSPENLLELEANVRLNDWKNAEIIRCAVGAEASMGAITDGLNGKVAEASDNRCVVDIRTLDSIVQEYANSVDLIKIDVEGYEWHVLKGAEQTLRDQHPKLLIEIHPRILKEYGIRVDQVIDLLESNYATIDYFDLPEKVSLIQKIREKYGKSDPCRRLLASEIRTWDGSRSRFGTFWALCQ